MYPDNCSKENQRQEEEEKTQIIVKGYTMTRAAWKNHLRNLERLEKNVKLSLSKQHTQKRKAAIKTMICQVKNILSLKIKTTEHALRLFDMVLEKDTSYLDLKDKLKLPLTCAGLSAKYIEVYPPNLQDLEFMTGDKIPVEEFMQTEIYVLNVVDFNLMFAVASDWYGLLYGEQFPEWGLSCYEKIMNNCSMKNLAAAIRGIEESHSKEPANQKIEAFFKLWGKKEEK